MTRPSTLTVALFAVAGLASAQSPAATESKTINGKTITISYSSPRVNGREGKLFGKDGRIASDPTYPVWRAGANAATKIHTDADLDIGGLSVPKGDYSLYVELSDPENWQLVINKQTGQSGTSYDKSMDVGRVKMTMSRPPSLIENLAYVITPGTGGKAKLTLQWENKIATVPVTVK